MNIRIHHISKRFGSLEVFRDFSLELPGGKVSCLLGPSGCGKTTLLNLLSGMLPADGGEILGTSGKGVATVFQEPRLLPWLNVRQNLEFIISHKILPAELAEVIDHTLEVVGLSAFANYYPGQLSGGMKQRLSLARAFAFPAELVLMDEPFRGLDPSLKQNLLETFSALWQEAQRSVVFVTHDLDEAFALGQEIILFSKPPVAVLKRFSLPADPGSTQEYRNEIRALMGLGT